MIRFSASSFLMRTVACLFLLLPLRGMADDTDIFVGSSGGAAAAPKVIILLDNSTSDLFTAKLAAISSALNSITATGPIEVGLAMWSPGTSPKGAYIRFAPRDMSVSANRTALQNILSLIGSKGESSGLKNEPEAFYEVYKYYSSLAPYAGTKAKNPNVDRDGNTGSYSGATAYGQGLRSEFAFQPGDALYNSATTPCGKNYIVYIAANNGFTPQDVQGQQIYEGLTAGPALPPSTLSTYWGDEWTHTLYGNNNPKLVTYVLDAASPGNSDAFYTQILQAEAKQGGGSWQYVTDQATIVTALLKIFAEVQSVNSTFASVSLPVNTTNRAQDKNQVFIPMFRPDPDAKPRWMGNMKQYQLISLAGAVALGDQAATPAINSLTGLPTDCAASFWTTDSGTYWSNVPENPLPIGHCPSTSFNQFSDSPDGPIVEKGGVAEVIRKGNNPPATNTTPTWAVNRIVYTQTGSGLANFTTATSGLSSSLVNFIVGQDVNDENGNANLTETRPSIHGDVIHSRPLPIDYGATAGVTVYYGANDGTLRAVNTVTGAERWALVAPEFFPRLSRLMTNSPLINYPNMPMGGSPAPTAKDYFFDGSIGVYQASDNSNIWIYPTMRRGGRMIYALDVTNPASPAFKWKLGCPNLGNDTGCGTGFAGIGQTWSTPKIVPKVVGYTGTVVIVGGGYDACEDANSMAPSCASPKGAGIYVLDANTGALIKSFSTVRSVVADVSMVAVATAGVVDHAYAVDTGGNIYRIDFTSTVGSWTINRVAYTGGSGRKFLFAPALLPAPGNKVYVAVGSGDREHPLQSQYPYSNVTNRFYVYLDDLNASVANDLDNTSTMTDFTAGTACITAGILPSSTLKGWFINLNQSGMGEQTVTSAIIASGMITFSTNRPVPAAAGTCSTTLGEARGYWLNLFNGSGGIGVSGACGGTRSSIFVGGGLPPSPVLGTVPVNGVPKTVVVGAVQRSGGASTPISPQEIIPAIVSKRKTVFWKSSGDN
jgi:type IV pilus assembly protein PilY1